MKTSLHSLAVLLLASLSLFADEPVLPAGEPVLPKAVLTDLQGEAWSFERLSGRYVLIDFWATWCKPCLKAMPELEEMQQQFGGEKFTVVGVSIDSKGARPKIPRLVGKLKTTYPIVVDNEAEPLYLQLGVKSIPAMFLVSPEGRILASWKGVIDIRDVREHVQKTLE